MRPSSSWLLLVLLFVCRTLASRRSTDYAVFSSYQSLPDWEEAGKPERDYAIYLKIGVKHGAFEELERQLYEVNDADHPSYGRYLSLTDAHKFTTPKPESLELVQTWLEDHEVDLSQAEYSHSKDWITILLPIWKVESLLDTEYHIYQDRRGRHLVRTRSYGLPKVLHQHIDIIQPTNYFGSLGSHRDERSDEIGQGGLHHADYSAVVDRAVQQLQEAKGATSRGINVTISDIRNLYRTIDYAPQVPGNNSIATTNWLGQTAKYSDLRLWLQTFRPDADPHYTFTYQTIANGTNNQSAAYTRTYEANIDIQAVAGLAYPTRLVTYSTGGMPPWQQVEGSDNLHADQNTNEPYLTFLNWLLQRPNEEIPRIIATSYGEDESTVPFDYAQRVCKEFAILSARGITLLFGSGDTGVGSNRTCGDHDRFRSYFPASCPYVTAVGGTSGKSPEVVGSDNTGTITGGGFSQYFVQPRYQNQAVERYLGKIGRLHEGKYNRLGRAYPDIAAQGVGLLIVDGGEIDTATGTSVAVQIAAGVLANVNDALIATGKPTLGFLNPRLYKYGRDAGFNDIMTGEMTGCNTSGFPAILGWDPASGWGTPDFRNVVDTFFRCGVSISDDNS